MRRSRHEYLGNSKGLTVRGEVEAIGREEGEIRLAVGLKITKG